MRPPRAAGEGLGAGVIATTDGYIVTNTRGALISSVTPGSPTAQAMLAPGDIRARRRWRRIWCESRRRRAR